MRVLHFWNTLYKPLNWRTGKLRYERERPRLLAHRLFEAQLQPLASCYEARRSVGVGSLEPRGKIGSGSLGAGGIAAGSLAPGSLAPIGSFRLGSVGSGRPGSGSLEPLGSRGSLGSDRPGSGSLDSLPPLYADGVDPDFSPNLTALRQLLRQMRVPSRAAPDRNLNGLTVAEALARSGAPEGGAHGRRHRPVTLITQAELQRRYGFEPAGEAGCAVPARQHRTQEATAVSPPAAPVGWQQLSLSGAWRTMVSWYFRG